MPTPLVRPYHASIFFCIAALALASFACQAAATHSLSATEPALIVDLPGVLWSRPGPGAWWVGNGHVYVIIKTPFSDSNVTRDIDTIVALDSATGDERWRYSFVPQFSNFLSLGNLYPASDGSVYAAFWTGLGEMSQSVCRIQKLNAQDGSLVWSADFDSGCGENVFFLSGKTLYVESTDYKGILAVDAATGTLLGNADGSHCDMEVSNPTCDSAIPGPNGRAYVNAGGYDTQTTRLVAFDGPQGKVAWQTENIGIPFGTAHLLDGGDAVIVYGADAGFNLLEAYSAETGDHRWTFNRPIKASSRILAADGTAYAQSESGDTLYAVSIADGSIVRTYPLAAQGWSVEDGVLWNFGNGLARSINLQSGETIWETHGNILDPYLLIVGKETLFILSGSSGTTGPMFGTAGAVFMNIIERSGNTPSISVSSKFYPKIAADESYIYVEYYAGGKPNALYIIPRR